MEQERLSQLLRALPRERARYGFTERVLRRLDLEEQGGAASRLHTSRLHRLMLASVTVAAVAVSVALLPREHTQLPLNVVFENAPHAETSARTLQTLRMAAALQPAPASRLRQLSGLPMEARGTVAALAAVGRSQNELDPAQARQMVQQLRLESSRLERELRNLERPAQRAMAAPQHDPYGYGYLNGMVGDDATVDLALAPGRPRVVSAAATSSDDGELYDL